MCFGTRPGRLALAGEDRAAPLVGIYFLHPRGPTRRRGLGPGARAASPNVLFFARERRHGSGLRIAADLVEASCSISVFGPTGSGR